MKQLITILIAIAITGCSGESIITTRDTDATRYLYFDRNGEKPADINFDGHIRLISHSPNHIPNQPLYDRSGKYIEVDWHYQTTLIRKGLRYTEWKVYATKSDAEQARNIRYL